MLTLTHIINNGKKFVIIILYNIESIFCINKTTEIKKILEKLNKDNISIFELDSNEYIHLVLQYYITKLPSLLCFKNGKYQFKIDAESIRDIHDIRYKINNLI